MITIQNSGSQQFRFNGISYYKNFTPFVAGNKVKIVNFYDSTLTLCEFTDFSEFEVNGNTFASAALLADALLPVLYFRGSLGSPYADKGIVSDAGFTVSSNVVTMLAGSQWKVNGVQYSNVGAVNLTFPFTSVGFQRIDLIVANESNTFVRIAGTSTNTGTVIAPATPVNTVLYSQILVDNTSITNPNPPVVSIGVDEPLQLDPITSKISIPKASTAQDGYLDKLDFADFREKFFEIIADTLRNKDNSLNMLFRFLSQKGLTIDTPSGSPDWKVLRLLNSAVEQFSLTQNGRASLSELSASDFLQGLTVRFGEGILHFLTQIQYANSSAANVRNAQLDSTGYTAAGGGGMLEYKFFSTDRATLRRELRLLCNLDLKRIDLHTFPGFTPINSTSETLIRTILIPANTLDAESAFELYTRFNFTDAAQTKSLRLRHSTTAGFSTAHTLIGTNNVTAATLFSPLIRTFRLSGGNLTGFGFNVSSANDIAASGNATGSTTFNPAVDNYIHISGFVANTSASITPTLSIIEKIIS